MPLAHPRSVPYAIPVMGPLRSARHRTCKPVLSESTLVYATGISMARTSRYRGFTTYFTTLHLESQISTSDEAAFHTRRKPPRNNVIGHCRPHVANDSALLRCSARSWKVIYKHAAALLMALTPS